MSFPLLAWKVGKGPFLPAVPPTVGTFDSPLLFCCAKLKEHIAAKLTTVSKKRILFPLCACLQRPNKSMCEQSHASSSFEPHPPIRGTRTAWPERRKVARTGATAMLCNLVAPTAPQRALLSKISEPRVFAAA